MASSVRWSTIFASDDARCRNGEQGLLRTWSYSSSWFTSFASDLSASYVPSQISLEQQQQSELDFNLLVDNAHRLDRDADIDNERVATALTSDSLRADEAGMYSPYPELSEGDTPDLDESSNEMV